MEAEPVGEGGHASVEMLDGAHAVHGAIAGKHSSGFEESFSQFGIISKAGTDNIV